MSLIVGIDLGTTNSAIGVMEAGFPILLADADGLRLTPSVVHVPAHGAPIAGRAAQRLSAIQPERTIASIKRFMGRRIGEEADDVSYRFTGAPGEPARVSIGEAVYSPEQISAFILQKLKADAERALEQPITRAVITVPAYFNDAQRQATIRAGELAGLTVERIVNEPTAAALAYGLDKLGEKAKIAVYDLGGGTFDISILELSGGIFQVLSTNGHTRLGGDDLDAAVLHYLATRLEEKAAESPEKVKDCIRDNHRALDGLGSSPEALARLREAARAAKHRLSDEESITIDLPFLTGAASRSLLLTRAELEAVAAPIIERTRAHCRRALEDARLTPADLDAVILVGGQTRMPLVRQLVADIFQREPDLSQNPDEAVALGATIQAGVLSGAVQNVVLLDVTPLSLGIETFGGLMNVIIPRNSTIPIKAGEMFTNAMAGQRSMLIRVLQGEREMARDNWELGKFELEFESAPSAPPMLGKGQARVGVQFEIDANGILHVLARDTKTGREQIVAMQSAVDVSDEAVEKMLGDSLEHAFEDMSERIFTEARLKAEEMIPAVRHALAQVGALLPAAEQAEIATLSAEVAAALASGEVQRLQRANAALDAGTQHLAALLVERAMKAGR